MIRQIKRHFAISAYARGLSQELARRFGLRPHYTIEEVNHTVCVAGFSAVYLAYAHAMFCSRADFVSYYEPLHVCCTYDGLRRAVSLRFFDVRTDFNASNVIRAMRRQPGYFYDCELGS